MSACFFARDMLRPAYRLGFVGLAGLLLLASACGGGGGLILATTTSTFDSGLLDELVPLFEDQTGINVKVIAVGTGQALEMGRRGDADVLLVHAPAAEEQFVEEGYGVNRQLVMHNDFVIVGPDSDPAELRRVVDAMSALRAIQTLEQTFVSRGDDSGTNKLERSIWEELDYDPTGEGWYLEAGQGMGATLQIANQREAYTITDRATYLALLNVLDLEILHEGDPRLLNIYHVMQVNPERSSNVQGESAAAFVTFMVSEEAQAVIAEFGIEKFGQALFVPDAGRTVDELREDS